MKLVKVKGVNIGEGVPKIAVSITGNTDEEIINEVGKFDLEKIDIVEWRADFYNEVLDIEKVLGCLGKVREILKGHPIIFTFRSKEEGGNREIPIKDYIYLNTMVAESELVDIIDIELFKEVAMMENLIKDIQRKGVFTIASYHDFLKTPGENEIGEILKELKYAGDIIKLAFMAKKPEDLFRLIGKIKEFEASIGKPMVVISMGELGKVSRVSPKVVGSSITFGSLGKSIAPGQVDVGKLYELLNYNNSL